MSTPKRVERTTSGIRDVMFDNIERFLNGEVDADHINALKNGFSTVLQTVQQDLQALKAAADMRRERGGPREVADLNLNLKLGGSVSAGIASIADQPDHVTDVTAKPNSTVRFLRKAGSQKQAANKINSSLRRRNVG